MRGFGRSASSTCCKCGENDKWHIVGYVRGNIGLAKYIVRCFVCHAQWNTSAKYADKLPAANNVEKVLIKRR